MADDVVGKLIFKVETDTKDAKKGLDSFQDEMKETQSDAKQTEETVEKANKAISLSAIGIALAVGTALVKMGKQVAEATKEIQDGQKIIANATGATGKSLEGLMESAKKVFASNDATFDEVSNAIGEINTRLGLTGKALEDTTSMFLDFADATRTDVKQSVQGVTQVMNRWGISAEKLPKLLDKLTVAGQASGISVANLTTNLTQEAGTLQALGYSMDEAIAMMMTFEKQGIDSSQVIMGMKKSFQESATAGTDAREDWENLINSIANATDKAEANSLAIDAFGNRIATDMVTALQSGSLNFDEFTEAIENSEGALQRTDEEAKTTADRIAEMKNSVTQSLSKIGEAFAPLVESILPAVSTLLDGVASGMTDFITALSGGKTASDKLWESHTALNRALEDYKSLISKTPEDIDRMTEAEKRLYDIQVKRARLDLEKQLAETGKNYAETQKSIDGMVSSIAQLQYREEALSIIYDSLAEGTYDYETVLSGILKKRNQGIELTEREQALLLELSSALPVIQTLTMQGANAVLYYGQEYTSVCQELADANLELEETSSAVEDVVTSLAMAYANGIIDLSMYYNAYPELVEKIKETAESFKTETEAVEENNGAIKEGTEATKGLFKEKKLLISVNEEVSDSEKALEKERAKNAEIWIGKLKTQRAEIRENLASELESQGNIKGAYAIREQIIRDEWEEEKKILEEKISKNEATGDDLVRLNAYYGNELRINNEKKNNAIAEQDKKLYEEQKKLAEETSKKQIEEAEKAKQKIKSAISSAVTMTMSLANQLEDVFEGIADNYKTQLDKMEKARNADIEEYKKASDERLAYLNSEHAQGLISDEEYKDSKKRIEDELADATWKRTKKDEKAEKELRQKVNDMERKAFEARKKTAIAQAIIDGASAVMKGFAELGPIAGAVYAGVQAGITTAQTIVIANQEYVPSYAVGSKYIPRNQLAMLHEGEMVLTRRESTKMREIGGVDNLERMVSGSVGTESRSIEPMRIDNQLNAVIEVDGTQLGIAVLKNIDNASQFVLR